jgi:flagellar hook assembly protein FlgD
MNLSSVSMMEHEYGPSQFSLYPNPFDDGLNVYSNNVSAGDKVSVYIYDSQGKVIKKVMERETILTDELHVEWDGKNESNEPTSRGLYFVSINVNGTLSQHRVIKK